MDKPIKIVIEKLEELSVAHKGDYVLSVELSTCALILKDNLLSNSNQNGNKPKMEAVDIKHY